MLFCGQRSLLQDGANVCTLLEAANGTSVYHRRMRNVHGNWLRMMPS